MGDKPNILLVEDDFLIAYDMKLQLEEAAFVVVGTVSSAEDALALLEDTLVCAAVLDMDLGGVSSFPIAHRLNEMRIPFLFVSGNDGGELPGDLVGSPIMTKPVNYPRLISVLRELLGAQSS
ncbi:response regulator [Hyphomonas atlantica corrig.]|uniref:response regulator n=1 Tax=Hyphomonas atlantica TaxID=1280948 RepID=UPI0023527C5B|nr:response regulator [Hyphomonas atlantica]